LEVTHFFNVPNGNLLVCILLHDGNHGKKQLFHAPKVGFEIQAKVLNFFKDSENFGSFRPYLPNSIFHSSKLSSGCTVFYVDFNIGQCSCLSTLLGNFLKQVNLM